MYTKVKKCTVLPHKMKAKPNCIPLFLLLLTHTLCMVMCHPCSGQELVYLILHLNGGKVSACVRCSTLKKKVKYSALPQATNATTTHNNQHEPPPPPYPLALSLHGNICHGPKSWHRCSLWDHTKRAASGALLPLFYPLFRAPKRNSSKNR